MTSSAGDALDEARRTLRASSRSGVDAVLTSSCARALLDELQRLQQSSDRLRRQNRRVRRRLAQHGLSDEPSPAEGCSTAEGDAADGLPPSAD